MLKEGKNMDFTTIYLDFNKCIQLFSNQEVYVFGTGIDAEQLTRQLAEYVDIVAYVDNYRSGDGRIFYEKEILDVTQYLERRNKNQNKNQPILIASYRFANEICEQLQQIGCEPGVDFFVWDDMYLYHFDENSKKYVEFMNTIWGKQKRNNTSKKVLLPFDNRHDLMSVIYAYCGNYFAEKHHASIYGYLRFGMKREDASNVIEEIYKSFQMKDLIDSSLSEEQRIEADQICASLWRELRTWEDWDRISIYGIHFGTTIVRHLLRVYIPSFDPRDERMYLFLQRSVDTVVFWYHYIMENDIQVVLLADGVSWDGYIRDIAITKGIPTYALCYTMKKMELDYYMRPEYAYFDKMWDQLTEEEQKYGIEWAKEQIAKRISGGTDEVFLSEKNKFTFAKKKKEYRILEQNNKTKIIICPHIFEEDGYICGKQIFDNNYFSWLCHLGELSERTPNYDWYLKMHPSAVRRDFIIIDRLLDKYPKIKKIPADVSPVQLREEGAEYALTVQGTIGHEYPAIGLQVINAGENPHSCFDFTWNPKTKEEYDNLIFHLDELEPKMNLEELYKFYCLNYLYYNWDYVPYRKLFFKNSDLAMNRLELEAVGKSLGTWKYEAYRKEWTEKDHNRLLFELPKIFSKLDQWRPDILYKKRICD